jgi:L-ascorbate metabolism protein UlaG (beta-lactamase superfamily)
MALLRRAVKVALPVVLLLTGLFMSSNHWLPTLGAPPAGERLLRVEQSPNYRNGSFQNPVPSHKMLPGSLWQTFRLQIARGEEREPPRPLPVMQLAPGAFDTPPVSGLRATWLGHATTLIEIDGARVLLDPVWSERASPLSWLGARRFHEPPLALSDLPALDAIVISHDHYDHLDMETVRRLAAAPSQSGAQFVVPLGVGSHLEHWGVAPSRIVELDWGQSVPVGLLKLTAAPARHFSGRGLADALGRGDRTLWVSWVIAGPEHRVFFSGDTGFFDGLAEIGHQHGPFDLTLIKIGAYGPTWPDIHLTPEEAVRVHTMLQGRVLLPVHWGTFNLAFHAWDEPAERVLKAADQARVELALPMPGQPVEPATPPKAEPWWRQVRTK